MPPLRDGICMGVDYINHRFAPELPPGRMTPPGCDVRCLGFGATSRPAASRPPPLGGDMRFGVVDDAKSGSCRKWNMPRMDHAEIGCQKWITSKVDHAERVERLR